MARILGNTYDSILNALKTGNTKHLQPTWFIDVETSKLPFDVTDITGLASSKAVRQKFNQVGIVETSTSFGPNIHKQRSVTDIFTAPDRISFKQLTATPERYLHPGELEVLPRVLNEIRQGEAAARATGKPYRVTVQVPGGSAADADVLVGHIVYPDGSIAKQAHTTWSYGSLEKGFKFKSILEGTPGQEVQIWRDQTIVKKTLQSEAKTARRIHNELLSLESLAKKGREYDPNFKINIGGANVMFDVTAVGSMLERQGLVEGGETVLDRMLREGTAEALDIQAEFRKYLRYLNKKYNAFDLVVGEKAFDTLDEGLQKVLLKSNRKITDEVVDAFAAKGKDATKYAYGYSMDVISRVLNMPQFTHHAFEDVRAEIKAYQRILSFTGMMQDDVNLTPLRARKLERGFIQRYTRDVLGVEKSIRLPARKLPITTLLSDPARTRISAVNAKFGKIGKVVGAGLAAYAAAEFLLHRKKEDYNTIVGLPTGWWAEQMLDSSDFGSPYKGPVSSLPLAEKITRERQFSLPAYFDPQRNREPGVWSQEQYTSPTGSMFSMGRNLAIASTALAASVIYARKYPYLAYRIGAGIENFGVNIGNMRFPGALFKPFRVSDAAWSRAVLREPTPFERKIFDRLGMSLDGLEKPVPSLFEDAVDYLSSKGAAPPGYADMLAKGQYVNDIYSIPFLNQAGIDSWNLQRRFGEFKGSKAEFVASEFERKFNTIVYRKSKDKVGFAERYVLREEHADKIREFGTRAEQRAWLAEISSSEDVFRKYFTPSSKSEAQHVEFLIGKRSKFTENEIIASGAIREHLFEFDWKKQELKKGSRWSKLFERKPEFGHRTYAVDEAYKGLMHSKLGFLKESNPMAWGVLSKLAILRKQMQVAAGLGPGRNQAFQNLYMPRMVWTNSEDLISNHNAVIQAYRNHVKFNPTIQGLKAHLGIGPLRTLAEGFNTVPVLGWNLGLGPDPRTFKGPIGLGMKLSLLTMGIYGAAHAMSYVDWKTKGEDNLGVIGKMWWMGLKMGRVWPAKFADMTGLRHLRDLGEYAAPDHPLAGLAAVAFASYMPELGAASVNMVRRFQGKEKLINWAKQAKDLTTENLFSRIADDGMLITDDVFRGRLVSHVSQAFDTTSEMVEQFLDFKLDPEGMGPMPRELVRTFKGAEAEILTFTRNVLKHEKHFQLPSWLRLPGGVIGPTEKEIFKWERQMTDKGLTNYILNASRKRMSVKTWKGASRIAAGVLALPLILNALIPKQTGEELEAIYSGEKMVPIRRGRWWTLSKTPFEGERISYYRPHAFHLHRTQAMSKAVYGGEDAYWRDDPMIHPLRWLRYPRSLRVAHEQYEERPYPIEPTIGENLPGFLRFPVTTVTRLFRPPKLMHVDEWAAVSGGEEAYYHPYGNVLLEPFAEMGGKGPYKPKVAGLKYELLNLIDTSREMAGMWGYGLKTSQMKVTGTAELDAMTQYLQGAGNITSLSRQYYQMELGDPFGVTEALRRFITNDRLRKLNYYNPIRNRMPSWITAADEYYGIAYGDPYARVPYGDIRLPGSGFEALHPELGGLNPENYPIWARYMILSDVFPYSEQTRRLEKKVERLAETNAAYAQLYNTVQQQNESRQTRVHTYTKRFLNDNIMRAELTVKGVTETGLVTEEFPGREIRPSGIEISEDTISSINDYISSHVKVGDTISVIMGKDPQSRIQKDEDTIYMNAIIKHKGDNISKELIKDGVPFKEQEPFDIPHLAAGPVGRLYGMWTETLGRAVNYIPAPFGLVFQKFSAQRTALEDYTWGEAYGRRESYWHRPIENIIKPIFTYNAYKYGLRKQVTSEVQRRRDIIDYFDKLEYLKYRRLSEQAKLAGDYGSARRWRNRARITMFGADPYAAASRWKYIADRREQPYLDAFVNEPDAENRQEILQMVPKYMRRFYMAQWAKKRQTLIESHAKGGRVTSDERKAYKAIKLNRYTQGQEITKDLWQRYQADRTLTGENYSAWIRRQKVAEYFQDHGLPDKDWIGWDPRVDLEDIKLKLIQNEGLDMHDFNLWEDRAMALSRKPYLEGQIPDIDQDNSDMLDKITQRLNNILELDGRINYNITRASIPSAVGGTQINIKARGREDDSYEDLLRELR